jgi:hypothetical protein
MFPSVARSGTDRLAAPSPWYSTNFPDHARVAQPLGDVQDQVGRGDAFAQPAVEMHAHHVGHQQVDRLAEHRRLGFDSADAEADHPEAIDHWRVRVGADQGVGIEHAVPVEHAAGEEFEIHLVADAKPRRHDAQALEGRVPHLRKRYRSLFRRNSISVLRLSASARP